MGTDVKIQPDTGWIMPTFATDVTQTATAGRKHLGYRRLNGRVSIAVALDVANPGAGKLLFTLPEGFRHGIGITAIPVGTTSTTASTVLRLDGDGTVRTGPSVGNLLVSVTYIAGA